MEVLVSPSREEEGEVEEEAFSFKWHFCPFIPGRTEGQVFKGDSYPSGLGVPFVKYCSLLFLALVIQFIP